jgi:hypothetical protein
LFEMKIFISSLITGMEPLRAAARTGVISLGHEPVMAEDFSARPQAPQVACLEGLRQSDAVILILGERYGAPQQSGLSATHQEYREAQGSRPVLAFVQDDISAEPDQAAFISEVQAWETGLFRAGFASPEDLQAKVIRALHEWELATATAPVDPAQLLDRALALLPDERGHSYGSPSLSVAIACGPVQPVLRPSQIEQTVLREALLQAALFGPQRIFTAGERSEAEIRNHRLVLEQKSRNRRMVSLDGQGSVIITLPLEHQGQGLPVLIEETVTERLSAALAYAGWVLEHIDPRQRLSHVVIAARIAGADHSAWRTQREHGANPNSMSIPFGQDGRHPVHLEPPHRTRAAFRLDAGRLVEDFVVLLRRQWR